MSFIIIKKSKTEKRSIVSPVYWLGVSLIEMPTPKKSKRLIEFQKIKTKLKRLLLAKFGEIKIKKKSTLKNAN